MALITDYDTLKASIASYLHRSDLTSMIPEFIIDGEARIYSDLRIRAMEDSFSGVTTSGSIALPTSFLEWKWLKATATGKTLEFKDTEWLYTNYPTRSGAGTPIFYSVEGDNISIAPYPADDTAIEGRYYKRLDALSDSNTTNWFITYEPAILRYAALCEAAPYLGQDARIPVWETKYQMVKERIKSTERRQNSHGSQLTMRAG